MIQSSYTISPDGSAITCRRCGHTSHHPMDVQELYCGFCHIFHAREFDCRDCGRHVVVLLGPTTIEERCATCQTMPKWFEDPTLAGVIDPDNLRRPKLLN